MWMRDAALREKLPHISDLDDPEVLSVPLGPRVLGVHRRASTATAPSRR